MPGFFDTIVAPITGVGHAAVAIVRLSGPASWTIAGQLFSPWKPEALRAVYGRLRHGDDGLALPFVTGHSYTGEECVEFSIHGSPASVRALVSGCIDEGARMAEPGEFTLRAFLNGRIDLTQAEAVRDTVNAQTKAQLRLANLQREGALKRRVAAIREAVAKQLVLIDATVDFSEEIGPLDRTNVAAKLKCVLEEVARLLETAGVSRIMRCGLRVAIVGPPNAGKSSLLNAVLGSDRAIVTEVPGTTRDTVEEQIEVNGFPVVLIDTAGLRESRDRVESLGIARSRAIAAGADHLWYVYDSTMGWSSEDEAFIAGLPATVVANKVDLARGERGIPVSALQGTGIPELLASLPLDTEIGQREVAVNARHAELLSQAKESLESAVVTLESGRPEDLVATLLQDAQHLVGQVTGETASADMIEKIFSDFCIGK